MHEGETAERHEGERPGRMRRAEDAPRRQADQRHRADIEQNRQAAQRALAAAEQPAPFVQQQRIEELELLARARVEHRVEAAADLIAAREDQTDALVEPQALAIEIEDADDRAEQDQQWQEKADGLARAGG